MEEAVVGFKVVTTCCGILPAGLGDWEAFWGGFKSFDRSLSTLCSGLDTFRGGLGTSWTRGVVKVCLGFWADLGGERIFCCDKEGCGRRIGGFLAFKEG